ncbi:hypothetical protein SASPL_156075 [Salvia splendens]|uniref:Uncharacterized protein n=1 Tax=Salvia splendens TaxID=180675 RepID=A0A8X8VXD7_SALSN|nr:hypothetical protein SASPL_156075 [Salvia splendens]
MYCVLELFGEALEVCQEIKLLVVQDDAYSLSLVVTIENVMLVIQYGLEGVSDVATGRDQRKPNRKTACLVANQELDHQPPHCKEEVSQVSVNQFGVLPVTVIVSRNNLANESGSNSIISDGCMGMNTLYVDSVTKEHNRCNRDYISVDINPIDDSLIDQACSKALNINNGVIGADDIEEQSTQVQALAETDFCTEFLDSVNPQVLADSQPLLSRGKVEPYGDRFRGDYESRYHEDGLDRERGGKQAPMSHGE